MKIKSKARKGKDWNDTKIAQKIFSITDDNLNFKKDYDLELSIEESKKEVCSK